MLVVKKILRQRLIENMIYLVIWLIIFLMPVMSGFFSHDNMSRNMNVWKMTFSFWLEVLPFFVLFLANNFLLTPRLFFRKKYWQFAVCIVALFAAMHFYSTIFIWADDFDHKPMNEGRMQPPTQAQRDSMNHGFSHEPDDGSMPPEMRGGDMGGHDDMGGGPGGPADDKGSLGANHRPGPPDKMRGGALMAPPFRGFMHLLLAILLLGFNIAVKLFFKQYRDQERMEDLERKRLETEMQYLRYQINPHFLMNTLNNIHALVDIEPEKAQETIRDLSALMRYVLYEAGNKTVPLSREIEFLQKYIALMKLHYSEKVDIKADFPSMLPDAQVPPLLFVSFIENAFKHGVSYREESFVEISMKLDEENRVTFRCRNSNHDKPDDKHHGIGVENVRKRLELMFPRHHVLSINKDEKIYEVLMIIPLQ